MKGIRDHVICKGSNNEYRLSRTGEQTVPSYYSRRLLPVSGFAIFIIIPKLCPFFSSDFCSNCVPFKGDSVKVIIPHGFYISLEPRVRYLQNM